MVSGAEYWMRWPHWKSVGRRVAGGSRALCTSRSSWGYARFAPELHHRALCVDSCVPDLVSRVSCGVDFPVSQVFALTSTSSGSSCSELPCELWFQSTVNVLVKMPRRAVFSGLPSPADGTPWPPWLCIQSVLWWSSVFIVQPM